MPNSRIPSPARSQGAPVTPRRYRKRTTRSVGSPARSTASGRLSNIVDQFKENRDSFAASPLSKTVLSDNTAIDMPRRQSWWRKVENSRDVIEVLENEMPVNPANVFEEFEVEVLTQEKKNYSIDLPESSDNESIHSIVLPQRKLLEQKENQPQNKFRNIVGTSEENKTQIEDKTIHVGTKNLFSKTSKRTKPVFPSALLNITADKTLANKTKELNEDVKAQPRGLFGRPASKRKNMFANFVVSESEDEIPDIVPKRFTFHKPAEPSRRSSNASSITTDMDMDDWKSLPSSTMVEHQLEAQMTTPGKRARLSKLCETKETINTDSTKQSNKSMSSKNKSKLMSPAKDQEPEKSPAKSPIKDVVAETTTQKQNTSQNKSKTFNKTKNMSQAQEICFANDEAKETSQVKNKTYNVTMDKKVSKSQNVQNHQENVDDVQITDKTQLTHAQNASQNKSKTFNKTENLSHTLETPSVGNDDAKETSQVKNKTYNINKTIDKQVSKTLEVGINQENVEEVPSDDKIEHKDTDAAETEPPEEQEDDEKIALTYDDNDPEVVEDNNDEEKLDTNEKTKTIYEDNRLSKVSEYIDDIEIEPSKIVGEETNNILQMETPMPNKSIHLTKKVVEETPESKLEGRQSRNIESSANKSSDNVKSQIVDPKELVSKSKENESTINQDALAKTRENVETKEQEIIPEQAQVSDHEGQAMDDNVQEDEGMDDNGREKEASDDEIEASDQDQAEASQEIDATDQEGTDVEQELEVDEEEEVRDHEPSEQEDEIEEENEESENEDQIEASQDEVENDEEIENEQDAESDEEVLKESQINEEDDHNESQEVEEAQNENEGEEEKEEEVEEEAQNESENEEQNESQEDIEEDENEQQISQEVADEQNESQEPDEVEEETDQEMEEDVIEASEEMDEDGQDDLRHEPRQSTVEIDGNVTHDTTGRNRKKRESNTPEAARLHVVTNEMESSMIAKGRNTSIRQTLLKNLTIRPSLAPARESTGISDGTTNSSAEGSGWDSHRTTRKTLRQTFGKDFTPRKSLRALVMEKSAKRQTQINEANELLRHQANSTELPDEQDQMDYEDHAEPESDHELSSQTREAALEMLKQKIIKENMEFQQKIKQQVMDSLKPVSERGSNILNFKPYKPKIRSIKAKTTRPAPKFKRGKHTLINMEDLPPELIEDMKYKPPKRFKPPNASWITKRLYQFLESKLEPKYDYKARVRAEKLVETIYNFVRDTKRLKIAPPHAVAELRHEMARLDIVNTYFEFYNFFSDYMPREVKQRVVPDYYNQLPLPAEGIYASIIPQ